MNKLFYPRLAVTNIRTNRRIYRPYLLAASLMVALFYMLDAVRIMVADSDMAGKDNMRILLNAFLSICGVVALVILFYVNSFVMKRRKREFGLYSILGMEKRHISLVMLWEVLFTGGFSLLCGIFGGALFSQGMFLIFSKIVHIPVKLSFTVPLTSIGTTAALFGAGFLVLLLYDIVVISRTDPIGLLHGSREGEREPKARWLLALLGILSLGAGYGLALTVKDAVEALGSFLLAVLLVIVGTYFLFTVGSIALLKFLKKRERFYYRPSNFISVSGMIYRMKQNAVGLANICILSTAVLVTVSSCVSLFIGEEDIIRARFPRRVMATCYLEGDIDPEPLLLEAADTFAKEHGLTISRPFGYASFNFAAMQKPDGAFTMDEISRENETFVVFTCMTQDDYNQLAEQPLQLEKGEAAFYVLGEVVPEGSLTIGSRRYTLSQRISDNPFPTADDRLYNNLLLVLPSMAEMTELQDDYNAIFYADEDLSGRSVSYAYYFDVNGDASLLTDHYDEMRNAFSDRVPHLMRLDYEEAARSDFYSLYGSLLFVGLFFVAMFLIATVLIIYYKQITEGFDDRERFQIMQQVGMSDGEVRQAIRRQVLMVFFLPLGLSILHIAVAFPVLCKILMMFQLMNTALFAWCTVLTVGGFALLYALVYRLTARTYYRIVQEKQ